MLVEEEVVLELVVDDDEEDVVVVEVLDELVVGADVVVVVAEMMNCANSVIFVMKYDVRVLYPVTDKCTPSATNRLCPLGVKNLFQSATMRFG